MATSSDTILTRLKMVGSKLYQTEAQRSAAATRQLGASALTAGKQAQIGATGLTAFSAQATLVAAGMRKTGANMTKWLTLPIVGMGALSIKAAVDYETAFAGVRKTIDATESEFESISKGIRTMAKEIPVSTTELAAIAEAAGQLGIENKNIMGFTRTMADLGVATDMTSEQAATALARIANITQMPQKNFDRLGATVVDLGNKLAATEGEIVEMGLRIAGAGNQVGMSQDEVMSFAGALASVGIRAEAGGTAISQSFLKMNTAVMSGGEELEAWAKVAGMSAQDFKAAFEKDAAGAMISFIEGIGRTKKEGGNVSEILKDLGLSGIRIQDTMLRASGAGDLFRKSLNIGAKAWKENTALTTEAERRYETTASQAKILGNSIKDVGITIGNELLPVLNDAMRPIIDVVGGLAEGFGKLPGPVKTFIVTAVLLLAAVGPVVWMFGALISAGALLYKGFMLLRLGWALLNAGLLISPIGLIILGVIALGAALFLAWKKSATFRRIVTGVFDAVWGAIKAGWEWIKGHWHLLFTILTGPFGLVVGFIIKKWDGIVEFIRKLPGRITSAARGMWGGIKSAFMSVYNWIKDKIDWVVDKIDWVKDKAGDVTDLIPDPGGIDLSPGFDTPFDPLGGADLPGWVLRQWRNTGTLPPRSQNRPLTSLARPEATGGGIGGRMAGALEGTFLVDIPVYIDGREVGRATGKAVADKKARK